jgi:hypothetical protein
VHFLEDCGPVDEVQKGVQEHPDSGEDWLPQLDQFGLDLQLLGVLAGQQVKMHLPHENLIPAILHTQSPVLANRPTIKHLPRIQIEQDMGQQMFGQAVDHRGCGPRGVDVLESYEVVVVLEDHLLRGHVERDDLADRR